VSRPAGNTAESPGSLRELPDLIPLLGQIHEQLVRIRELGLLSITVLRRDDDGKEEESWEDYEAILHEISLFLPRFRRQRMRRSDVLLDPLVSGNTFVVLLDRPRDGRSLDSTDLTRVRHRLSRRLQHHLERGPIRSAVERYGVYVGASLMRHEDGVDSSRIIYHALEQAFADALGQRKREGRRQAVYLQRVLRGGQVHMVYQPVVDVVDKRVLGYEALTRLPGSRFATPDLLFRVAQENGLLWQLERLCRQRALECLPKLEQGQLLFLNHEPESFHDPELLGGSFLTRLSGSGLEPRHLVLELTEHAAVKDFSDLRRTLGELRALGFRLALDDVGSGYAGLRAIAEIRPDFLKVDMMLVRNLHADPIKRELIATIRRFAESTGITLVAEGVETTEELDSLAGAGVRCAQGFLFARPDSPPGEPDWDRLAASEPACPTSGD
jgi:EAL domain-containing protein (putative c-di-GMP-specific phosphodiesterase class I)